jgi:hypothetical protein
MKINDPRQQPALGAISFEPAFSLPRRLLL